MLRIIAGVIVGFLVMTIVVMAVFAITVLAMGMDNILKPGTWWTTDTFNIIVLAGGIVAAIIGGMTCKAVARNSTATLALVAIVLILGGVSVVLQMKRPDPPPRTGSATLADIQTHGKEPNWFAIMKTLTAAAGLLIGSSLVSGRRADS